jgi:hypothetical protein
MLPDDGLSCLRAVKAPLHRAPHRKRVTTLGKVLDGLAAAERQAEVSNASGRMLIADCEIKGPLPADGKSTCLCRSGGWQPEKHVAWIASLPQRGKTPQRFFHGHPASSGPRQSAVAAAEQPHRQEKTLSAWSEERPPSPPSGPGSTDEWRTQQQGRPFPVRDDLRQPRPPEPPQTAGLDSACSGDRPRSLAHQNAGASQKTRVHRDLLLRDGIPDARQATSGRHPTHRPACRARARRARAPARDRAPSGTALRPTCS